MSFVDSLSVKQLKQLLAAKKIDCRNVVEKPALKKLVSDNIKENEVELLLSNKSTSSSTTTASSFSNNNNNSNMGTPNLDAQMPDFDVNQMKQAAQQMKNMDGRQLKYQAQMMRNDPGRVRSMQPQFAHLTDAQIIAQADQLERMADDPAMMKQAAQQAEMMSSMSPEQIKQIQKMQANMTPEQRENMRKMQANMTPEQRENMRNAATTGGGGNGNSNTSNSKPTMDPAQAFASFDEKQIESMFDMVKSNPELFKTMMKSAPGMSGLSDAQIDAQMEALGKMDPGTMKKMMGVLKYFAKYQEPMKKIYETVNKKTGGNGTIVIGGIALIIILIVLYFGYQVVSWFLSMIWGMIFGTGSSGKSTSSSSSYSTLSHVDEFGFDEDEF